jgi:hypothetical protein
MTPLGYTTRSQVEQYLNRTFAEVDTTQFNNYIASAEAYINNFCGYNAQTTHSGMLAENITREKSAGKVDNYGNLVVDLMKPPVQFDANNNPIVSLLEFNFGGVRVPLTLTDGTANSLNTVLEVSESRNKLVYPSLYFMPYLPTVTPTQKTNLYSLRDTKFWVDVSYTGGYYTLPGDVVQATNMLVGYYLTNRDNPNNAVMVRQGSYSVQYQSMNTRFVKGEPVNQTFAVIDKMLGPYTRYTW